jgi:hypothetical protein
MGQITSIKAEPDGEELEIVIGGKSVTEGNEPETCPSGRLAAAIPGC